MYYLNQYFNLDIKLMKNFANLQSCFDDGDDVNFHLEPQDKKELKKKNNTVQKFRTV